MAKVLLAGLQVAACQLHLEGCVSLQLGRGARKLEGIANMDDGLLIWWDPSKPQEVMHSSHAPSNRVNLEALFGEDWRRMAFVQFLCVDAETVTVLRQEFGDVKSWRFA